jgi:S1-C subfamily serine protease
VFAETIARDVHPATWAVLAAKNNASGGKTFFHLGTAFAVDDGGHLITCWHCTFMDAALTIDCAEFWVVQPQIAINVAHPATLIQRDKDRDVALLKIADPSVKTHPAKMCGQSPSFGSSCCAFGHPMSLGDATSGTSRIFTRAAAGIVSMDFVDPLFPGGPPIELYELDFFTHAGSSGGPVFLPSGEVFGFVRASRMLPDGSGKNTRSNLSIAVSIKEAVKFLQSLNVNVKVGGSVGG